MSSLQDAMKATAAAVVRTLEDLLPEAPGPHGRVLDAMRYACLGGGKRLRPFLVVSSARVFDVCDPRVLRVAAAAEMVHCYSLVHDDLPAMDDSDLRRGRATVHKAYDEATAVLAGDGLLTEAFSVLAAAETHADPQVRAELIAALARASGPMGMVGGQAIDISDERAELDLAGVENLQALKTGALISFACEAGGILGRAAAEERAALRQYAENLGVAFQIADDLLDAEGTAEELGKPTGQDEVMGKATFIGQLGLEGAREEAKRRVKRATAALDRFGDKANLLRETAFFVIDRRS